MTIWTNLVPRLRGVRSKSNTNKPSTEPVFAVSATVLPVVELDPPADTAMVRALRSAAAMRLSNVAAVAGVDRWTLRDQLEMLTHRGGCAATLAEAASNGRAMDRASAVDHRACPPFSARAAASDDVLFASDSVPTAAGWSTRRVCPGATRAALIAAATQEVSDSRTNNLCLRAAEHRHTPAMVLYHLAGSSSPNVQRCAARNPDTPAAALERLAVSLDAHFRHDTARNSITSAALLERLSTDPYTTVRCGVAQNLNTPPATLERLARDQQQTVREAAAETLVLIDSDSNNSVS